MAMVGADDSSLKANLQTELAVWRCSTFIR